MMNQRLNLWIITALFLYGCKSRKVVELPSENYVHAVTVYKDSATISQNMYVYSKWNCDEIQLQDTQGNRLVPFEETVPGKNGYRCLQFERISLLVNIAPAGGGNIFMSVLPNGDIGLASRACSKFFFSPVNRWKDSIPVVMWTQNDTVIHKLKLYYGELQIKPPYYKMPLLDSIVVDYPAFCSRADLKEERMNMQSLYDKNLKIEVTPNPFIESFNLQVNSGRLKNSQYLSTPMTINFYDENGNSLLSQIIEADISYTFSFAEVPKGKMVYYRINIGDYFLGGEVLKSR